VSRQRALTGRGDAPLLDLTLVRERVFAAGLVTQLALAVVQASFFVYLALYLQLGRGLGALDSGLVFGIVAIAYVAASAPAPALAERLGRGVVVAGGGAMACGLALLAAVTAQSGTGGSLLAFAPGLALVGAGIGLCFTPLTAVVLANVDPDRAGAAAGTLSTVQQVGFSLGVAITGLIFFGAGDDVGRAFELSLIQLTAGAVVLVAAACAMPAARARTGVQPAGA